MIRTAEAFTGLAAGGPSVPMSAFNVRIGRDRRVAWVRTDLDRLKRARAAAEGSTVNDVVLSVATGALRHFFESRERKPPAYLVALVPVSIRRPDEKGELGNRISTILVKLPVGEPDPRKRLALLRDETARLKESDNARAASLIIEATGWAPPTINRLLSSAMTRPLLFNLVVSNVPGPQPPPSGNNRREAASGTEEGSEAEGTPEEGRETDAGAQDDGDAEAGAEEDRAETRRQAGATPRGDSARAPRGPPPQPPLGADEDRRPERDAGEEGDHVGVAGPQAAGRVGAADRSGGPVDGDPIAADPVRRQVRLVAG